MTENYDSKTPLENFQTTPTATSSSQLPLQSSSSNSHDNEENTPPPYSSSTLHIPQLSAPPTQVQHHGLPQLDYTQYCPSNFKAHISSWLQPDDEGSIITSHELYSRSPEALKRLIKTQASLPPKPVISVKGIRSGTGVVDFDLKINLMSYLIREGQEWNFLEIIPPDESASSSKKKKKEPPADELDDLAKRFCKDNVMSRQLVLTRRITNWDTETIEGRLRLLISRLSYPGQVSVHFQLQHAKVTIQPPQKTFAVIQNLFRTTKKYELKAVWPYADMEPERVGNTETQRCFAVQSEEGWWRDWRDPIKWAVLNKRKGWVTGEDRLEFLMSTRRGEGGEGVWSDA